jgi:hypothetical protein
MYLYMIENKLDELLKMVIIFENLATNNVFLKSYFKI